MAFLTPATHPRPWGCRHLFAGRDTVILDPSTTPRPTRGDRDPAPPGNPSWESPEQQGSSLWLVDPPSLAQVRPALVPYLAEVSSLELLHLGELELALAGAQTDSEAGAERWSYCRAFAPAAPAHGLGRAQALP